MEQQRPPNSQPLSVRCPNCNELLEINSDQRILAGECPACRAWIEVELKAPVTVPPPVDPNLVREIVLEVMSTMQLGLKSDEPPPPQKPSRPEKSNPTGKPSVQFLKDLEIIPANDLQFEKELQKELQKEAEPETTAEPRFFQTKEKIIAGGAIILCLLSLIYLLSPKDQEAETPSKNEALPQPKVAKQLEPLPPGSELKIGTSLQKFSLAKSPQEMLPLLLPADNLLEKLTAYYGSRPKDFEHQRLKDITMRLLPSNRDDLVAGIGTMQITIAEEPSRVLVFMRQPGEPKSPYRLDWESYIQEMDRTLEDFLHSIGTQAPGVFRVRMKRTHVFDELEDTKAIAITLGTISGRDLSPQLILFPDHPLYSRIDEQLPWNQTPMATIRLAWLDSRLRLEEFICWEMLGVARNKESPGN